MNNKQKQNLKRIYSRKTQFISFLDKKSFDKEHRICAKALRDLHLQPYKSMYSLTFMKWVKFAKENGLKSMTRSQSELAKLLINTNILNTIGEKKSIFLSVHKFFKGY